jgi:UDP-N-acetylglucosamine--N-acetylmuramyl-(pentapeptide) pyrophosphoryl-undecaprenol N-acetylglucosamine transferase
MTDKARQKPRILFAGGGTGGHVYPAIAIADAIREIAPDSAIEFAGTRERMEWQAVPKAGYKIHPVTVSGLQRSLSLKNLAFPFRLGRGFMQSVVLVQRFNPDVVVGTGGYVSAPVLLAGNLLRRPIVVQEQNAYAGMTNKVLARVARSIHIAFPEATNYFDERYCHLSGNPTRRELQTASRDDGREMLGLADGQRMLFVFGGSLGSEALNSAMEKNLEALLARDDLFIYWQSGERYYDALAKRVQSHDRLKLVKYVDRMDLAYAAADLALCRAGAITCSELLVTETPAVLVPSPNVAEDHQTKNAMSLKSGGAADLLLESELMEGLVPAVSGLLDNRERLELMKQAARKMARPDAATTIAKDVLTIAGFDHKQSQS